MVIPPFIGKYVQWSDISNTSLLQLFHKEFEWYILWNLHQVVLFTPTKRPCNLQHDTLQDFRFKWHILQRWCKWCIPFPKKNKKNSWLLGPLLSKFVVFKFVHLKLMTGEARQWDRLRPGPGDLCCGYISWFWSLLGLSWDVLQMLWR